ncbi:hypothetical protein H5410_063890 [Solanum commersonii]|uniref:TOD1/MUCI70 glycosyltransferase-like domain-containing protein n=1 Tax=Solanum commersonii TaxID=4109 RepID=A0A9J5WFW3_SOLCO|nr:hypothetical protein H5410_063890 [Solanum commersonii]
MVGHGNQQTAMEMAQLQWSLVQRRWNLAQRWWSSAQHGGIQRIGADEKKDESKPPMSLPELTSATCIRVRKFIIVDCLIFDRIEFELKVMVCGEHNAHLPPPHALAMIQTKDSTAFPDPCRNFAFPPPPPACPVCYVPVEQAIARMPRTEPHRGSAFGGYPSLVERNASFDIKEPMTLHCGSGGGRNSIKGFK